MLRTVAIGLAALVSITGCSAQIEPPPVGPDGGTGDDMNATPSAGLTLEFRIKPELPGSVDVGEDGLSVLVEIATARFGLENVSALGDAAPGDERTVADRVDLDAAVSDRPSISFGSAPPGIYSQVLLRVAEYRLTGTSTVAGETVDFEIHDLPPGGTRVALSVGDLALGAGDAASIRIDVRLKELVEELELESQSPAAQCPNPRPCYVVDGASSSVRELREHLDGDVFRFHE